MGLLDRGSIGRYHDAMTGKSGRSAARQAAIVQGKAVDEARAFTEQREQQMLDPYQQYVDAGQGAFADLVRGSTIGGYGDRLSELRGSDVFRDLAAQRTGDAARYLASQGISRSSSAAERIGDIGIDTLMGLENQLTGRAGQVSNIGYNALGATTNIRDSYGQALRDLILRRGGVDASGILGAQQAQSQGAQNQYTALHNVGSGLMQMFGSGFGGGGGGDSTGQAAVSTGQQGAYQSNYGMPYNTGGYQSSQPAYWNQPLY